MTLRLSVDRAAWQGHLHNTVDALVEVLPVVKGNGYGFGRVTLMPYASQISHDVAVGSIHELVDVPATMRPFVLTPTGRITAAPRHDAVLTLGSTNDLTMLLDTPTKNPVVIKIESSMRRFGSVPVDAVALRRRAEAAGHEVVAWSVHLPLDGDDDDRVDEVVALTERLPVDLPIHLSHVGNAATALRARVKQHVVVRCGTRLWLGDKSMLSLHTEVLAVRATKRGEPAGYRRTPMPHDGWLVMVGCGSSHGVAPLDGGLSPFHHARRRLALLELPHMHSSMLAVGDQPCPSEGDWIDVQAPLTRACPDIIDWN